MRRLAVAALLLAGCRSSAVHPCGDGFVCPPDLVCAPGYDLCVHPEQLTSCVGKRDGDACSFPFAATAYCVMGICSPATAVTSACGNGVLDAGELCDGAPPPGQSCLDYGFDAGTLSCSVTCGPNPVDCRHIGWRPMTGPSGTGATGFNAIWGTGWGDFWVGAQVQPNQTNAPLLYHYDGKLWTPAVPQPADGGPVLTLFGTGMHDVWAQRGVTSSPILHFDGTAWSDPLPSFGAPASAIWASAPNDVYITSNTDVWHFDGTTATRVYAGTNSMAGLDALWGSGPADVYAGGFMGVIHYDGKSWSNVDPDNASAIWGSSSTDVYVAGGAGVVHFDGAKWANLYSGIMRRVWGSGPNDVFIAGTQTGDYDEIFHFDGKAFTLVFDPEMNNQWIGQLWGTGPREMYAVQSTGGILRYEGSAWLSATAGPSGAVEAVYAVAPDDVYAVGLGFIYHYQTNSRAKWDPVSLPRQHGFVSVWGSGPNDVWAVGADPPTSSGPAGPGALVHFDGTNWIDMGPAMVGGGASAATAVWGTGPNDVYVGGGRFLTRFDGATWNIGFAMTPGDISAIWGSSNHDIFVTTSQGVSHYDGSTWTTLASTEQVAYNAVWGTAANDVWLAAADRLSHWDGSTVTVVLQNPGDLRAIWGFASDDVFAAGKAGAILHWNGTTWSPVRYTSVSNIHALGGGDVSTMWIGDEAGLSALVRTVLPGP